MCSAFQTWETFWPSAKVQPSDQPVQALDPELVSCTSAWKPPDHWLVTLYVTVQAPVGVGVGSVPPPPPPEPPPGSEVSP